MGSVCRKHQEFYEERCRWCEPAKAEGPPAAPSSLLCMVTDCAAIAAWRWVPPPGHSFRFPEYYLCANHHSCRAAIYSDFKMEPLP